MFLKRIELTGFKSFAAKTVVEFLPGVTIIVGPNGCGKSNIFDAVRWVLGEQSAKSLRGSRMGDVIFSGSASTKALSYSQVSLVIDNESRSIPLDFSEITVTRRLFSTGESEYLLNRVNCRLKDITELFMDTGVGLDAYSFMGQGKVDQIITAKPVQRRYIFEEAAGISKYKARKEEALRKLIRTEEDLLRVADIIDEVRRSANSLKRQASKAERYKRLVAKQRDIEKRLLILRHKSLAIQSETVEKSYGDVQERYVTLKTSLASLNARNEEGRNQSDSLNSALSEYQSHSYKLKSDIEGLRHRISLLNERISNSKQNTSKLASECEEERVRAEGLQERIRDLETRFVEEEKSLHAVEKEYENKKSDSESLKDARLKKRHKLEECRSERAAHLSEKSRLVNEIRYTEATLDQISARIREEKSVLEAEQKSLQAARRLLETKRRERADAGESVASLEEKIETLRSSLGDVEENLSRIRCEYEDVSKKLRDDTSRLEALEELKQNFEGFQKGVKAVMKASGSEKSVKGLSGVIATAITLPEEYESAIEAALGNALQSIVAPDSVSVEKAISYLRDNKAGQAAFLPRDIVQYAEARNGTKNILKQKGVIGLARELVKTDDQHRSLVDALLGDTILVDDLSVALSLVKNGMRKRYVTKNGDCVDACGSVRGGSPEKTVILSRERKIRDFSKSIKKLEKKSEESEKDIAAESEKAEKIRNDCRSLEKELHSGQVNLAGLSRDLETAEKKCEDLEEKVQQRESALQSRLNEREKLLKVKEENSSVIIKHEEKIDSLDKEIEELVSFLESGKDDEIRLDQEVSRLLVEKTRLREQYRGLSLQLDSCRDQYDNSISSIKAKEEEIRRLDSSVGDLRNSISESEQKVAGLQMEKEEIDREIDELEKKREEISGGLKELNGRLMAVQRDYNEVQNRLHEIELKRTQFATQRENLSQQAEEKFQATLDELLNEMPEVEGDREELINNLGALKEKLDRIGPVNAAAIDQYQEAMERFEYLTTQEKDLQDAKSSLKKTIEHIDQTTTELFQEAFELIRSNFIEIFRVLFAGGRADLVMVEEEENSDKEPGIDIIVQPPGKKLQNINLLSGGEKSLTAIALLFAIFKYKPSPFCLLDEIDAALDDANVGRFKNLLHDFSADTQFIIVTHNKQTMSLADTIYGVTMQEPGVSRLVSVKFENLDESRLAG